MVIDDDDVIAIDFGRRQKGRLTFNERDELQRAIGRLEIHPPHTSAETVRDAIRYALTMDAFAPSPRTHGTETKRRRLCWRSAMSSGRSASASWARKIE